MRSYDDYKNRPGNLTLLEKTNQYRRGQIEHKAKQGRVRQERKLLTRSLVALTEVGQNIDFRINAVGGFPAWNAASIEKRHALLIALAQEV